MNHGISEVTRRYLSRYEEILSEMMAGMTGAELTQSISHNFIVQMIPHHRAAIEMSQNVLKYIRNRPLRRIAEGIITEQTQSIAQMEEALPACAALENTLSETEGYQQQTTQIMEEMFSEMTSAPKTNQIAEDFMREMIPHHEGAIRMSETALQYPICGQLKPILSAIIESQKRGVSEMEALLRAEKQDGDVPERFFFNPAGKCMDFDCAFAGFMIK